MTKLYRIRRTDEEGTWWWQTDRRCWCDSHEDATAFPDYYEARRMADAVKPTHGKVRVIGFESSSTLPST
jgi:cation diffusion facilitator CzcD-associated flavoprotein CzcO